MKPGERRGHRSPQVVVGWCAARKVCAEALIAEETAANSQYSLCLTYNDNTLETTRDHRTITSLLALLCQTTRDQNVADWLRGCWLSF